MHWVSISLLDLVKELELTYWHDLPLLTNHDAWVCSFLPPSSLSFTLFFFFFFSLFIIITLHFYTWSNESLMNIKYYTLDDVHGPWWESMSRRERERERDSVSEKISYANPFLPSILSHRRREVENSRERIRRKRKFEWKDVKWTPIQFIRRWPYFDRFVWEENQRHS